MSSRRSTGQGRRVKKGATIKEKNVTLKDVRVELAKRQEIKFLETQVSNSSITNAGVLDWLSPVTQGSTSSTRVGDFLNYKSLIFRGKFGVIDTTYDTWHNIRFLVILWKDNSVPTVSQIIENPTAGRATTSAFNHENKRAKRFRVLFDSGCQYVSAGQVSATAGGQTTRIEGIIPLQVIPLNNMPVQFDVGSANHNNRLYCLSISDTATASQFKTNIEFVLKFTDS